MTPFIRPAAETARRWVAARPHAVHCGALASLLRLRERHPFWGELCSGFGAVLCGVISWGDGVPLESHPVLGGLARLVGGHAVEAVWIGCGLGQVAAVLTDRWPWRWVAALVMCAGWGVPVLQALKASADAPVLAGACMAWVVLNALAAWSIVRHGVRDLRRNGVSPTETR